MASIYDLQPKKNLKRNRFDLSYSKLLTCDMGQLIPVSLDEVVPGDVWNIDNKALVRMQPLVAPILGNINMYVHYYFVPYRLLDDKWENFITGGVDNDVIEDVDRWTPTNTAKYSLWDYLGFPVGKKTEVLAFPKKAYNTIYNEYYRDENFIEEIDIDANENILRRLWKKDYFTSALPWQQRGQSATLPVSGGVTNADFTNMFNPSLSSGLHSLEFKVNGTNPSNVGYVGFEGVSSWAARQFENAMSQNVVDLSNIEAFDINDLRIALSLQSWMERNARGGIRYTEFLKSHFGVAPRDSRLQRPEYIGGSYNSILVSEVVQTSSTDSTSPQGNLAGHGISYLNGKRSTYKVQEYGLIMGIMSIVPDAHYQDGVDRSWTRETKYDFYFPDFANLSEQAILNKEIYLSENSHDNEIFGYQGRYDEMRIKRNIVTSDMRDTFDYWHLGRKFSSLPALNQGFLECNPSKRIFAVQNEPGFIVSFTNLFDVYRPLPSQPIPSL